MSDKALFVMDMQEYCVDCIFCFEIDEGTEACCTVTREQDNEDAYREIKEDYCQCKPDWCPLKPMPEKKNCDVFSFGTQIGAWRDGWNACIDMVLEEKHGETDTNED